MLVRPLYVSLKEKPEEYGFVVSENVTWSENSEGQKIPIVILGVCLINQRSPAIQYFDPSDLEWHEVIEDVRDLEEEDENPNDESEEEEDDEPGYDLEEEDLG